MTVVILSLLLLSGSPAPAQQLVRGPYLQKATPHTMTVRWRTDAPVQGGLAVGLHWTTLDRILTEDEPRTDHEIPIDGLDPATTYFYAIGNAAPALLLAGRDPDHSFRTPPTPGRRNPIRIWVLGDSGRANAGARAVRDAYLAFASGHAPDVWLMLGDNAYQSGTDSEYQRAVFDLYPSILRRVALWPAYGNHDALSADAATETGPYFDMFSLPRQAEAGGVASGTEAYYSFDHGNVHFVCLDSSESPLVQPSAMLDWIAADLASPRAADWTIAFFHHPPYTKGSHDSDRERTLILMRENVVPLLESHGVDLVLAGHSHSYERSLLLDGHYGHSSTLGPGNLIDGGDGRESGDGAYATSSAPRSGAVYVVAGSSGISTGGPLDHPAMQVSLDAMGSLVLDVDATRLDVLFLDDLAQVRDHVTLRRSLPGVGHYGVGTPGTDAVVPLIDAVGEPLLGSATFAIVVRNARPLARATLVAGRGRSASPGEGGIHLTSEAFRMEVTTGARGRAVFSLPLPADPERAGAFYAQILIEDPVAADGVALTGGLEVEIH